MTTDAYVPTREDKFSFGIWTVGWQGVDVFGDAVRPPMPADRAVRKLAELGAYGVNFHDNDVFGFEDSSAERDAKIAAFRALEPPELPQALAFAEEYASAVVDEQLAAFLESAVLARCNIIVAGATDAGRRRSCAG